MVESLQAIFLDEEGRAQGGEKGGKGGRSTLLGKHPVFV
jgi:hypothetical protein